MRRWFGSASVVVLILGLPGAVEAGGIEYTAAGVQALGRGGAVTARADDPMVLAYNPAGLAELRGTQFLLNFNLALFDACVEPAGYYGWGVYRGGASIEFEDPDTGELQEYDLNGDIGDDEKAFYEGQLDTVCLEQNLVPIPQLAWTKRISERLGIGFGLIFPAAQPAGSWGGRNGVIEDEDGNLRPSPVRYMQLQANNIGVFPNIGLGYRLMQELRLGLALEWGIVAINTRAMAASTGGTLPRNDIVSQVQGEDLFVPAFTVSAHIVPDDALDVVLAFRWQDDIDASGKMDFTTGLFHPTLTTHRTRGVELSHIRQKMPWKLRAGVRYADRLAPRPEGTGDDEADAVGSEVIHDPLQDERWDLELDVEYQLNARNETQEVIAKQGQAIELEGLEGEITEVLFPRESGGVPQPTTVDKFWKDQVSVRLGGTYNLLPGRFGISAGAHYENRGVDPSYMHVDFWPLSRLGLHTGIVLRVMKSIDITLSYAHIFQETLVVTPPAHGDRVDGGFDKRVGTQGDDRGAVLPTLEEKSQGASDGTAKLQQQIAQTSEGQPRWITNSGTYRSNFDVVGVGMNLHF